MIIPWLKGFLSWNRAPLTWTLLGLNLFVFIITYQPDKRSLMHLFSNREEIVLTGRLYDQFLQRDSGDLWALRVKSQDDYILLGSQGLRDPNFIHAAEKFEFAGDDVAIKQWKKTLIQFQDQMQRRSSYVFGLLNHESRPMTWITYQFMHAGLVHLFSNMILLMLFAGSLELLIGGAGLVIIYLLCGLAGGVGFMLLSHSSIAPMVGASGALSGVMACYAAFEKKRRVPFFFFLSPMQGYFGLIHLPTWLIFPLCFLTDIASYLSTPVELGSGVAYTAHIGGALFGALVGFLLRGLGFKLPSPPQEQNPVSASSQ